jgi:hypothetical protein
MVGRGIMYYYLRKEAQDIIYWTIKLLRDKEINTTLRSAYGEYYGSGVKSRSDDLLAVFEKSEYKSALESLSLDAANQYLQMIGGIAEKADLTSKDIIKNGIIVDRCPHTDGAEEVARFIAGQMKTNVESDIVRRISECNRKAAEPFGNPQEKTAAKMEAFILWYNQVKDKAPWDYKPVITEDKELRKVAIVRKINPETGTIGSGYYHKLEGCDYYYDVWANIHYGYIGRICGFLEEDLLLGADMAQRITNLLHLRIPYGDTPSDKAAIKIGFTLYNNTTLGSTLRKVACGDIIDLLKKAGDLGNTRLAHACQDRGGFTQAKEHIK